MFVASVEVDIGGQAFSGVLLSMVFICVRDIFFRAIFKTNNLEYLSLITMKRFAWLVVK